MLVLEKRSKLVTQVLGRGRLRKVRYHYIRLACGEWSGWLHVPRSVYRDVVIEPTMKGKVEKGGER
jgi:hypothetical protein